MAVLVAVIMAVIMIDEVAVVIIIAKQKISYKKRLEKKKLPWGAYHQRLWLW